MKGGRRLTRSVRRPDRGAPPRIGGGAAKEVSPDLWVGRTARAGVDVNATVGAGLKTCEVKRQGNLWEPGLDEVKCQLAPVFWNQLKAACTLAGVD